MTDQLYEVRDLMKLPPKINKCVPLCGKIPNDLETINLILERMIDLFSNIGIVLKERSNLDDDEKTVDSFFSLKEENFKKMVVSIREVEASLGTIEYGISKSSKKNLNSRRSIYISKRINKGEKISLKNIRVVRPSFGLHPKYFKKVLGKKINKNLNFGDRLMLKYVSKD